MIHHRFFAAILLTVLLLGGLVATRERTPRPQLASRSLERQATVTFGPQLFLVSPKADQMEQLASFPLTIHAALLGQEPTPYIATGDAAGRTQAEAAGIPIKQLDASTAGKAYYFVDARVKEAPALAEQQGEVLYSDPLQLLVAVPVEEELTLLETLASRQVSLSLLPSDPIVLAEAEPHVQALDLPGQADPTIAALLTQVTESGLSSLIADLSGERPVSVDGAEVLLRTRFTLASNIRDAERYLHQYYTELGLDVSYDDWTYGSYQGRNLIADLPGVTHPERIWLVGGHFDSISESPHSLAPGADDNSSGTAATLLIASILRDQQLADTVRFVHFSGEEQGQWGSRPYVRGLRNAGVQVMGYLDLDMIGWDGNGDRVVELHTGMDPASNDLASVFISANQRYEQGLTLERKQATASRFSDHSPFWDAAYPAFLVIENFFDDELPNDRNPWYHNSGDRLGHLDLDYIVRSTRTALAWTAELAGLLTAPPPDPTSTPEPTAMPEPDVTATPPPASDRLPSDCQDLLANGDFESDTGWTFGFTPRPAGYVSEPAFQGSRAVRLGSLYEGSDRTSYSSASQLVTIPAWPEQVLLRYWQRPGGGEPADYRETLLLNPSRLVVRILDRDGSPGSEQWEEKTFELTGYRGQTVLLYFNAYNDGTGNRTWNHLDDVALLACGGTPTP
ncbi:MAG: M20/M25/M40 family metallo-hydrolase [Chloroflexota bacterium]|nr:M20/M25/M40 family metallo-hydrolase [Chloroflexota bacterium]